MTYFETERGGTFQNPMLSTNQNGEQGCAADLSRTQKSPPIRMEDFGGAQWNFPVPILSANQKAANSNLCTNGFFRFSFFYF